MKLSILKCADERTIITTKTPNGGRRPVLVQLAMRKASTANGRVKCILVAVPEAGKALPMPFAGDVAKRRATPEFRLEMN